MELGIVLIAGGKPAYGRLAFNFALGLKLNMRAAQVPIVLFADSAALKTLLQKERLLFDAIYDLPPALYRDDKHLLWGRLKCSLDKLTPFRQTLFLMWIACGFRGRRWRLCVRA